MRQWKGTHNPLVSIFDLLPANPQQRIAINICVAMYNHVYYHIVHNWRLMIVVSYNPDRDQFIVALSGSFQNEGMRNCEMQTLVCVVQFTIPTGDVGERVRAAMTNSVHCIFDQLRINVKIGSDAQQFEATTLLQIDGHNANWSNAAQNALAASKMENYRDSSLRVDVRTLFKISLTTVQESMYWDLTNRFGVCAELSMVLWQKYGSWQQLHTFLSERILSVDWESAVAQWLTDYKMSADSVKSICKLFIQMGVPKESIQCSKSIKFL